MGNSWSRRKFLGWMSAGAAGAAVWPGSVTASPIPLAPRLGPVGDAFAPFPVAGQRAPLGLGTYQCGEPALIREALERGVHLIDTSPDYRDGELETWVGQALPHAPNPVFVMTQLPEASWEAESREQALDAALEASLQRLGRPRVDALFVRNAELTQLVDPAFRAFALRALRSERVGWIGASGHGPGVATVLAESLLDPLIGVVLFGAHLMQTDLMPQLLGASRRAGVKLVAMKCREAGLWFREPGWQAEDERRRDRPWDGSWDEAFTRRSVDMVLRETEADNAVLSVRREEDLRVVLRSS